MSWLFKRFKSEPNGQHKKSFIQLILDAKNPPHTLKQEYFHPYKINDYYNCWINIPEAEASAMKLLLSLLQTSKSSSLDDGKMVFFWQQRIKLPLGNYIWMKNASLD